jgi:hypothetical protein
MRDDPTRPSPPRAHVGWAPVLALAAAGALLVGLDFVIERHPHFAAEGWPGFYGLCGAAACLVGVGVALLLRLIVQRPEDHYDR